MDEMDDSSFYEYFAFLAQGLTSPDLEVQKELDTSNLKRMGYLLQSPATRRCCVDLAASTMEVFCRIVLLTTTPNCTKLQRLNAINLVKHFDAKFFLCLTWPTVHPKLLVKTLRLLCVLLSGSSMRPMSWLRNGKGSFVARFLHQGGFSDIYAHTLTSVLTSASPPLALPSSSTAMEWGNYTIELFALLVAMTFGQMPADSLLYEALDVASRDSSSMGAEDGGFVPSQEDLTHEKPPVNSLEAAFAEKKKPALGRQSSSSRSSGSGFWSSSNTSSMLQQLKAQLAQADVVNPLCLPVLLRALSDRIICNTGVVVLAGGQPLRVEMAARVERSESAIVDFMVLLFASCRSFRSATLNLLKEFLPTLSVCALSVFERPSTTSKLSRCGRSIVNLISRIVLERIKMGKAIVIGGSSSSTSVVTQLMEMTVFVSSSSNNTTTAAMSDDFARDEEQEVNGSTQDDAQACKTEDEKAAEKACSSIAQSRFFSLLLHNLCLKFCANYTQWLSEGVRSGKRETFSLTRSKAFHEQNSASTKKSHDHAESPGSNAITILTDFTTLIGRYVELVEVQEFRLSVTAMRSLLVSLPDLFAKLVIAQKSGIYI